MWVLGISKHHNGAICLIHNGNLYLPGTKALVTVANK